MGFKRCRGRPPADQLGMQHCYLASNGVPAWVAWGVMRFFGPPMTNGMPLFALPIRTPAQPCCTKRNVLQMSTTCQCGWEMGWPVTRHWRLYLDLPSFVPCTTSFLALCFYRIGTTKRVGAKGETPTTVLSCRDPYLGYGCPAPTNLRQDKNRPSCSTTSSRYTIVVMNMIFSSQYLCSCRHAPRRHGLGLHQPSLELPPPAGWGWQIIQGI